MVRLLFLRLFGVGESTARLPFWEFDLWIKFDLFIDCLKDSLHFDSRMRILSLRAIHLFSAGEESPHLPL